MAKQTTYNMTFLAEVIKNSSVLEYSKKMSDYNQNSIRKKKTRQWICPKSTEIRALHEETNLFCYYKETVRVEEIGSSYRFFFAEKT